MRVGAAWGETDAYVYRYHEHRSTASERQALGPNQIPVERTHAWGNQYGKLRWCTQRRRLVVDFWLALAGAAIVRSRLVRCAWTCYRWEAAPGRP